MGKKETTKITEITEITESIESIESIVSPLLKWFDQNARILPWRETPSPYRVWISEIMLQQTRVEAVKPYFERFLQVFPDVETLSQAEDDLLLKMWEGLGYYNRVRNLREAAKIIMNTYLGELPSEKNELMKLPGIGDYTSGAISSIAFGNANPAVDGNVMRVITRVCAEEGNILDKKVHAKVEKLVNNSIPAGRPGDFNQALMELGAIICIPNGVPKCEICPLYAMCLAREKGRISSIPYKEKKKERKTEEKTVLIIQSENNLVIRKRSAKGLLAGMYEFPSLEGIVEEKKVLKHVKEIGFSPIHIKKLEDSRHIFTHREWHMSAFLIKVEEPAFQNQQLPDESYLLIEKNETERKYPIPSAFKTYTKYLKMKIGNEAFPD